MQGLVMLDAPSVKQIRVHSLVDVHEGGSLEADFRREVDVAI